MATEHYGLLGTAADAPTIDKLLFRGAESHQHRGGARPFLDPSTPLLVELQPGAGLIPGGTDVHYLYTLVNGEGFESGPSPEVVVSTPPPTAAPAAPAVTAGEGVLAGGNYLYAISGWRTSSSRETVASTPVRYFIAFETPTGVTVTPQTVAGLDGYNVYRRAPGDYVFGLVATVEGWSSWTDNGSALPNFTRILPTVDTSNLGNTVQVTLPSAAPAGYHWALYRTYTADWSDSLVGLVLGGNTVYADTGAATQPSGPPSASELPADPLPVQLTNGAEVAGILPMGMATFPLDVRLADGEVWVCEMPHAQLLGVRAVAAAPVEDASSVQVLDKNAVVISEPTLDVGAQVGGRVAPSTTFVLEEGDWLRAQGTVVASLYLVAYGFDLTSFQDPA